MTPMPMSPYAVSKLAAEQYVAAYHHTYGLDVLPFRFFNVFGPVQPAGHVYAAVVPQFVDAALSGRPLQIHGDGLQTRDFTFVGTVAEVIHHAVLERVCSPLPTNLAYGTRTSLMELIAILEGLLGHPVEREHLPTRPADVRHSQASNERLRELFPDVVPIDLATGMTATLAWHRSIRAANASATAPSSEGRARR
jgi:UDP-glucose 4-epimerase